MARVVLGLLLFGFPAFAAEVASSTVTGRITNQATGDLLANAVVSVDDVAKSSALFASASGSAPIERIDVIHRGEIAISVEGDGSMELVVTGAMQEIRAGDCVYVRVLQADGGLAWSSPIFVR